MLSVAAAMPSVTQIVFFSSLLWSVMSKSCVQYPFIEQPEMYYDYRSCSTVLDWTRVVSDQCLRDIVEFEIQLIEGCRITNFSTINTRINFSEYVPGSCLADNDCLARIKAKLNYTDSSWSDYSPWIGISNKFQMFEGTPIKKSVCILAIYPI